MPDHNLITAAALAVRQGGIIAYPTEAVFGLGCLPQNLQAVQRILELKQRPVEKGLILIAADCSQLEPYLGVIDANIRQQVEASWPGPVTWLMPAADTVSELLRGAHDSIAVRVTAHPVAAELCHLAGSALVSTSANIAGRDPARSIEEVKQQFGEQLDYILDGSVTADGKPSEIRDAISGRIIRPGPYTHPS